MAWRWSGDKPLSGPTSDNYLYHFTNSDLLYIWCPRVDAIGLITRSPFHSKGNHSPHGLYTQSSDILNFGVKLITGLCQLTWTVTPEGYANIGNLYIGKTASLYWTVSQKSNVRDQVQCFCCQQCYINHYNTPPCRRMLTHDTVKNTAVQRYYVNSVCPGSSTTNIPHAQHANKDRNVLKYYICTRTEATLWMQCLQINQLIVA